jgi:pilus assembly protein CpaE
MSIRIHVAGDCDHLGELALALGAADGIALVDDPRLDRPDVTLLGTRSTTFRAHEVDAARAGSQTPVVLAYANSAPVQIEQALRAGVADVLLLPQAVESVIFTLRKAGSVSRLEQHGDDDANVVTVFSPKGGTGKSATSTNLAVAIAGTGRSTLLLDLDLQFGDVAIMLGIDPLRTVHDLASAAGELDAEKLAAYATRHDSGLDVLAAPLRPEEAELITETKIAQLLDVAVRGYETIVVDTSPFFHSAMLATLDRTTELLLLCTPDVPALKNVRLALQTLELLSLPDERIRLVLNRPSSQAGLSRSDVAGVLERRVDFELPHDPSVQTGINRGNPAASWAPASPYPQAIGRIVAGLLDAPAEPKSEETPQLLRRLVLKGRPA